MIKELPDKKTIKICKYFQLLPVIVYQAWKDKRCWLERKSRKDVQSYIDMYNKNDNKLFSDSVLYETYRYPLFSWKLIHKVLHQIELIEGGDVSIYFAVSKSLESVGIKAKYFVSLRVNGIRVNTFKTTRLRAARDAIAKYVDIKLENKHE